MGAALTGDHFISAGLNHYQPQKGKGEGERDWNWPYWTMDGMPWHVYRHLFDVFRVVCMMRLPGQGISKLVGSTFLRTITDGSP